MQQYTINYKYVDEAYIVLLSIFKTNIFISYFSSLLLKFTGAVASYLTFHHANIGSYGVSVNIMY